MRLFTALEIPETICETLGAIQGGISGAKWVPEENMHLTLRFIGEVNPHTADDIDSVLSGIAAKPFPLTVQSVGIFGDPPRVLWAGVEKSDPLLHLVDKVDSALTRLKVDFDKRRYVPHVTLARFGAVPCQAVRDYLRTHGEFRTETFMVTNFVLYSSVRTQCGGIYTPERYYIF